jgi:hypothetical protein
MNITTNKPFTKSVFKIALSCPTKLYYARHPEWYANSNDENDFLAALAEGGFQVGELAKIYTHVDVDLHEITDYTKALAKTEELLARDKVVIAEAAFGVGNMFIRADIVRKDGNRIDLIEVKAKSFNPETDTWMAKRANDKNSINSAWREYLYDLAFQRYVVSLAEPKYEVHSYLMLADKSRVADVDNLNQLFKIHKENGRTSIEVNPELKQKLESSEVEILTAFEADEAVHSIINGTSGEQETYLGGIKFVDFVKAMCEAWTKGERIATTLSSRCFKCEFCNPTQAGMRDGRDECWLDKAKFAPSKSKKPLISELWSPSKRDEMIKAGLYYLQDLTEEWVKREHNSKMEDGLSAPDRRWLQIAIATQNKELIEEFGNDLQGDTYLDCEGIKAYIKAHDIRPPYHMIDFETTAVALPYYKDMHPYEQVAFQFSHHIITPNVDGTFTIEHAGQWLNEDVNAFPNFKFVRALKSQLEQDNGTIFRYSHHENNILNAIKEQLEQSNEPDKEKLIAFIDSITHETKGRKGERDMIDLCDIVKKFYYCYSQMHGSNSIKQVLPAVLNSSSYLQNKYCQKIYGKDIPSQNIPADEPIAWISRMADGTIDNPYHLLPSVATYLDLSEKQARELEDSQSESVDNMTVANGGAALTAYSKLMFCDGKMDPALRKALLRYCELDTMAMVFIWEYFLHIIYQQQNTANWTPGQWWLF